MSQNMSFILENCTLLAISLKWFVKFPTQINFSPSINQTSSESAWTFYHKKHKQHLSDLWPRLSHNGSCSNQRTAGHINNSLALFGKQWHQRSQHASASGSGDHRYILITWISCAEDEWILHKRPWRSLERTHDSLMGLQPKWAAVWMM